MSIVTKLTALLTADSAQFESGIKRAKGSFSGFTAALTKGAALAGTAVAAIGAAMAALGIKQAIAIGQNKDLADSLGQTYAEFQNLSLVAEEAGASQGTLTTAMTKTQKAVFEAANGVKGAVENFDRLGLSVDDLTKMSPSEQFIAVGTAIGSIEDPTARTAMALELFGKSGREIINMLPDLSGKVAEAAAFNEKFNISLSQIDAAKVDEAGDAFGRVGKVAEGAGNTIAVTLSPLVTDLSNRFVQAAFSGEDFGYAVKYGMTIAALAIDVVRQAVLGMRLTFNAVIGGMLELSARAKEAISGDGGILRGMANEAKAEINAIKSEMVGFETTAKKLDAIYSAADRRAAVAPKSQGGLDLDEILSRSSDKTDELTKSTEKLTDVWGEFGQKSGSAIDTLISDLGRGQDAMQSFRNFAMSMLQDIVAALNGGTSIGTGIGQLLASSLSGMSASSHISSTYGVGGELGSVLGDLWSSSTVGSFATGIQSVPYDMTARVHKGEAIVPASQVDNMTNSGSGQVINIDARGAAPGVEQKIRQVMSEVQQLRKDTPGIALNVVADQKRRNPNY